MHLFKFFPKHFYLNFSMKYPFFWFFSFNSKKFMFILLSSSFKSNIFIKFVNFYFRILRISSWGLCNLFCFRSRVFWRNSSSFCWAKVSSWSINKSLTIFLRFIFNSPSKFEEMIQRSRNLFLCKSIKHLIKSVIM